LILRKSPPRLAAQASDCAIGFGLLAANEGMIAMAHSDESVLLAPVRLEGTLSVADRACGVVLFAHGSGSSRLSPRNAQVAAGLQRRGIATLLFDLLSDEEANDRRNVFDIPLLAERLVMAHDWLDEARPELAELPKGYFGASTGAAAALVAAAEKGGEVAAVVSRGGRPDLASPHLRNVTAATLLIVGGHDTQVIELNRQAFAELRCEKALEIVPGATHLFEEPGALEIVTEKAAEWFARHLA
jgi:putative phosphoribosyl transferase